MNLEKLLNDTKTNYTAQYRKIFANFYPKTDNKGFEERNMSHNFAHALIATLQDKNKPTNEHPIVWFEVAWHGAEKIDAIVFSPVTNSVFFIEAKRIVNGRVKRQLNSLNNDFKRIYFGKETGKLIYKAADERNKIINLWKSNNKTCFSNQYIVCLADIWREQDDTKLIPKLWLNKELLVYKEKKKIAPILFDAFNEKFTTKVQVIDFKEFKKEFQTNNNLENYNLLISITEIKD